VSTAKAIWIAAVISIGSVLSASAQEQTITVAGRLNRVMAIGAESTGWMIQLKAPITLGGKRIESLEVSSKDTSQLQALADTEVTATGVVTTRQGVETGERRVLQVSTIQRAGAQAFTGTEWILEDLGGEGVVGRVETTIAFGDAGRVAGNAACNSYSGTARMTESKVKFGPLRTTRKMCPQAVMNQESKYLKALESAERIEIEGPYLLIHGRTSAKPLRFTSKSSRIAGSSSDLTILFSRVWRVTKAPSTPASGSIYVFLPNGTMLQTSCTETYRIARWTVDKAKPSVLRVVEDGELAWTGRIAELTNTTLRLQQELVRSNEKRNIALSSVDTEHVCPDIRK
jgi:heat shock protein HslJ